MGAEAETVEFNVGDVAVHPNVGVGQIKAIETKEILGCTQTFYVLETMFEKKPHKVMIAKGSAVSVGLRPIISEEEADEVIEILKERNVKFDKQTWNRRYRQYMEKIKTGSVYEIAQVLRALYLLKVEKELSYSERDMLERARKRLLSELALAKGTEKLSEEAEVAAIFGL